MNLSEVYNQWNLVKGGEIKEKNTNLFVHLLCLYFTIVVYEKMLKQRFWIFHLVIILKF
jgi:hypothetical protein